MGILFNVYRLHYPLHPPRHICHWHSVRVCEGPEKEKYGMTLPKGSTGLQYVPPGGEPL